MFKIGNIIGRFCGTYRSIRRWYIYGRHIRATRLHHWTTAASRISLQCEQMGTSGLKVNHTDRKRKDLVDRLEDFSKVLSALARAIDARDHYTQGHCTRVSYLAKEIGKSMNLEQNVIDDLGLAGLLHDIGKIGIPESILNKPGKLTHEEMDIMKTHPVIGEKILKPLKTTETFRSIIRSHHERLDGTGYPDGHRAEQIVVPVRVIAVADVFDALRSDRPYRNSLDLSTTLDIIEQEIERGFWDRDVFSELKKVSARDTVKFMH